MPLTSAQAEILRQIASNRCPESYFSDNTVLRRDADSPRFSEAIDLFHDLDDSIAQSAAADAESLRHAGYVFSWVLRTPTFQRALVEIADQKLKMEWAYDSAFRFFSGQKGRPLRLSAA